MSALSAVVPSLAWALLDFVWQGLLVGWAAALLFALLRAARPQARYAVGCAALLLCAALPLAGVVQRLADAQPVATTLLPLALAEPKGTLLAAGDPAVLATDRLQLWEQALQQRLPLVMLLWAAGAALLASRMLLGLLWVRHRSDPVNSRADPAWQARVTLLADRFGVRRPVRLGLVDDLPSPVTAGWWRPVILLPASLASGMPLDLLEALLAHEMAHIRRLDYLVNLAQGAIEIVLFYHPTVWWLSNRIRLEREQIADDLAASMLGEPRRLALALSELDRFQLATTPQLAHAAHGGNLMSRIKRLVRPESEPLTWKMALPILGLTAACAAFYANAQTAPTPQPRTERLSVRGPSDTSYALVRPGGPGTTGSGDSRDWKEIEKAKRMVPGDFLWFRQAGKAYIVTDAGVIANVIDAWAPVHRLSREMDGYGGEMEEHGKVMEALGREMEQVAQSAEQLERGKSRQAERKMADLGRQQERLSRQMEELGRQMDSAGDTRRAALHREMDQLSARMDELGRQTDQQGDALSAQHERMSQAREPMRAIGDKMAEAGKPMDALGKKMDALGKRVDAESRVSDKAMRALIDDALARGLATLSPAS